MAFRSNFNDSKLTIESARQAKGGAQINYTFQVSPGVTMHYQIDTVAKTICFAPIIAPNSPFQAPPRSLPTCMPK